jgi:serine/threonine-protein kinase
MTTGLIDFVVNDGPEKGRRIPAPGDRFVIGSGAACAVRFPPHLVREAHAEVEREADGTLVVKDVTNASLMWIDGAPARSGRLEPGRVLRLGRLELLVAMAGVEQTARVPTPFADDGGLGRTAAKATPGFMLDDGAGGYEPTVERAPIPSGRFELGDVIDGRYRIISRIATGGMGEVFRVEHVELGKALALKVMRGDLGGDLDFANRFKIEAVAASRIGHPNIIDVSDFGRTATGQFYFVMEFLDGFTLSSLVHRQGPQDARRAVALVVQIARALAAAHELSIIHRDLKPDNVMVLQRPGNPDHVKVLDFGIARVQVNNESIGKTAAGIVVGTPQYMSPEQTKAMVVDARSDIYSLGLIFYELLAGKPAFTGETPPIVMVKQVTEPPPPLPDTVPREVSELVLHMLEKHPDDRPQAMSEVVTRLNALRSALTSFVPQPEPRRPSTPGVKAVKRAAVPEPRVDVAPPAQASVEVLEPPPESKAPLIGVALGLVAVVAASAVVLSGSGSADAREEPRSEPEVPLVQPPPTPTRVAVVKVKIVSEPPGAEVLQDGVLVGNAPLSVEAPAGTTTELSLSLAGYAPLTRALRVSDEPAELTLKLEKLAVPERPKAPTPGAGRKQVAPVKQAPVVDESIKGNPFQ